MQKYMVGVFRVDIKILILGLIIGFGLFTGISKASYTINGDIVTWENSYGKLSVTPHTSYGFAEHTQYANITSYLPTQDLDFGFEFDFPVKGRVYNKQGEDWNDITDMFVHKKFNGRHYYWIKNVNFNQYETKQVKWTYYTPNNLSGKWGLWAKRSSDNLTEAIESEYYIYLDPWWDSDWIKKKAINISVSSGSTEQGFQVPMNITYDSDMQTDFDDIRFVNGSENTELDYWIEEKVDSSWAYVWVEIDQNITTTPYTIYMYYGNSTVSNKSNGTATFLLFDDFEDGDYTNNPSWDVEAGTWSVATDRAIGTYSLKQSDTTGGQTNTINNTLYNGGDVTLEYDFQFDGFSREVSQGAIRYQDSDNLLRIATQDLTELYFSKKVGGIWTHINTTTSTYVSSDNWYHMNLSAFGSSAKAVISNATWAYELSNSTEPSDLSSGYISLATYEEVVWFDNVRLRKYHDPMPTYSIGQEIIKNFTVVLNSPSDNAKKALVTFNCSVIGNNITNITLYGNWTGTWHANETNYSGLDDVDYIFTKTIDVGIYEWNCRACNTTNDCIFATSNRTIEIVPSLIECGGISNETAINFTLYDEDNRTNSLVGDLTIDFVSINTTDGYSLPQTSLDIKNKSYFEICIFPENEQYIISSIAEYNVSNYATRYYYLTQSLLNNQTNTINIYSISSGSSQQVVFTIKDVYNSPEADVILKIQRYFIGEGQYIQVAMGKSDFEGETSTYLKPNQFYIFILERNNAVLRTFSPKFITSSDTSIELMTTISELIEYYEYFDTVASSCTYNNDTYILRCSISDTSGKMQEAYLDVKEVKLNRTYDTICSETGTGSSIILTCNLSVPALQNKTVAYNFYARFCCSQTTWMPLASGFLILNPITNIWLNFGILIVFMILLPMAFIGRWNPSVAIVMSLFALAIGLIIGFISNTSLITTGFMSLVVVGAIIIWKMRV